MSASHLPRISIITPVRNAEKTLARAIKSVTTQAYPHLEYIVLDGASTDGTLDIIKAHENQITYWESQADGSPNVAMNRGIQKANGDVIAFLFADDEYQPDLLNKIGQIFAENPNLDLVSCGYRIVEEREGHQHFLKEHNSPEDLAFDLNTLCFGTPAIGARFIRKNCYNELNSLLTFNQAGQHFFSADREFLMRLCLKGVQSQFIPHMGYHYLAHSGSATLSHHIPTIKKIYREHIEIVENFLEGGNLSPEQKQILLRWQNDQSARLFLRELWNFRINASLEIFYKNFRKSGKNWIKAVLSPLFFRVPGS